MSIDSLLWPTQSVEKDIKFNGMPCVSPYFRGRVLCLLQTCTGVTGIARAIGSKHLMLHLLHRRFQQSDSTRDNLWPWKPKQKLHLHLRAGLFVYVSNGIYFNSMATLMVEAWLFLIELHLVSFRINMT